MVTTTAQTISAVWDELDRQTELWGEQNHALIGLDQRQMNRADYESIANDWKAINDDRVEQGGLGWDGILLEECFEALGAETLDDQVTELVQVAAVAITAAVSLARQAATR